MDCKTSLWTWKKDIVVAGNGIRLAYHVPMQFPAYSSIGKKLSSICIGVFMSPHVSSGVQPVQPPIKRRPLGRPKKKRTREVSEPAGRRAGISKQCRSYG